MIMTYIHAHTHPSVGDMAVDHIAGLAFGGQQPHSSSEHIVDPNVLVIHSVKVTEKLSVYMYSAHNVYTTSIGHFHPEST